MSCLCVVMFSPGLTLMGWPVCWLGFLCFVRVDADFTVVGGLQTGVGQGATTFMSQPTLIRCSASAEKKGASLMILRGLYEESSCKMPAYSSYAVLR